MRFCTRQRENIKKNNLPFLFCFLNNPWRAHLSIPTQHNPPLHHQSRLCPREVKSKPECRELSQLLNLSTHPQHYPLKINHTGKPPYPSVSCSRLICEHTCRTLHWELFGDFSAAVPGSRCENGGNQAWCFSRQCANHNSDCTDMEVRWEMLHLKAVPQNQLTWYSTEQTAMASGFILSNFRNMGRTYL